MFSDASGDIVADIMGAMLAPKIRANIPYAAKKRARSSAGTRDSTSAGSGTGAAGGRNRNSASSSRGGGWAGKSDGSSQGLGRALHTTITLTQGPHQHKQASKPNDHIDTRATSTSTQASKL